MEILIDDPEVTGVCVITAQGAANNGSFIGRQEIDNRTTREDVPGIKGLECDRCGAEMVSARGVLYNARDAINAGRCAMYNEESKLPHFVQS